jgi:hypothetical protein
MVFCEKFAGRAEAADYFHRCGRRLSAGTEQFGGLILFQRVFPVVLAVPAVFPADRPVLFGILNNRFIPDLNHGKKLCHDG